MDALPELIIIDIGGNDLDGSDVFVTEVAAELLLHVKKILDRIPAYICPRAVILEQHRRSRIRGLDTNYVSYNRRLVEWHSCMSALHRIDARISFQPLFGLNGPLWFRELVDGVHLNSEAQQAYLHIIQYVIHSAYHGF